MLTSPAPGEGKSLTSTNLAVCLARRGFPVLLVDADLRRPVLHKIFQLSNELGLSDILKAGLEPGKAILEAREGLSVLPSGHTPNDPGPLLESDRMRELIDDLKRKYRFVLFDTPPVLSTTDAALLAPLVDGTILVLSSGTTIMAEARQAKTILERANGKVLGSVLNNLDPQFSPGYHKYANYYTRLSPKG